MHRKHCQHSDVHWSVVG